MFKKEGILGEGAYGIIHKVKALSSSMLSDNPQMTGQRVLLPAA